MQNPTFKATTILSARRPGAVAMAGDGQVTLGNTIAKPDAVKVRKLEKFGHERQGVLVGFAGAAADAFALMEHFEKHLEASPTNLRRASIGLARLWRTDRALRRLESMMIVADLEVTLMVSGQGDLIEPTDGLCAIGSGGSFALSAARGLMHHGELAAAEICEQALQIAAGICIYTNDSITTLSIP
ncbi:MAG: ATP-dependent protease subunit HslV [Planctomycetota bacterium]|nr:ATP-dependent protease subunit HslV [Planctomycetota bacterium]